MRLESLVTAVSNGCVLSAADNGNISVVYGALVES
jgi:hypothetical protein